MGRPATRRPRGYAFRDRGTVRLQPSSARPAYWPRHGVGCSGDRRLQARASRRELRNRQAFAERLRRLLDPAGIDFNRLDLVFGDFSNGRANQKARFGGEFFPSTMIETDSSKALADFFQVDRFTGKAKGILEVSINTDPVVARRMNP